MPFDGITVNALAIELKKEITGSRIDKIFMPEKDEVVLSLHNYGVTRRLRISLNPSHPGIFLTEAGSVNPPSPPNFCMFMRKHISGGFIRDVNDYGYERYLSLLIESKSDLGDMQNKTLMVELTGRNCNLILMNSSGKILDALRHIDSSVSSVREVMPARDYVFIPSQGKLSPDSATPGDILDQSGTPLEKAILGKLTGFSPVLCREICKRSKIDPGKSVMNLSEMERDSFNNILGDMLLDIRTHNISPCVVLGEKGMPVDFHAFRLAQFPDVREFSRLSEAIDFYYSKKGEVPGTNYSKTELKKAISRNIERCRKKIAIHANIADNAGSVDEFRIAGELITSNIHRIPVNSDKVELLNYYTGEYTTIALDPNKDAPANAGRYFKKYKKAKSALVNARIQMDDAVAELEYLESVEHSLAVCAHADEVEQIRKELSEQGYIKKKHPKFTKKEKETGFRPIRYISSEGYEIFVGRNNLENDYLTFKFANSRDLWLHAKGTPGSHVIIRKKDKREELFPDKTISEAAVIAAYHSRAGKSGQTAVDYSEIKNIRKPNKAKPGMVNYSVYFSAYATPDEGLVLKLRAK
ncbi:MAG: NFACT family protein [Clostridia bacterium]|nr:NFACT family protein [Clostridia bacterium]